MNVNIDRQFWKPERCTTSEQPFYREFHLTVGGEDHQVLLRQERPSSKYSSGEQHTEVLFAAPISEFRMLAAHDNIGGAFGRLGKAEHVLGLQPR